jgi:hypothetical protein
MDGREEIQNIKMEWMEMEFGDGLLTQIYFSRDCSARGVRCWPALLWTTDTRLL